MCKPIVGTPQNTGDSEEGKRANYEFLNRSAQSDSHTAEPPAIAAKRQLQCNLGFPIRPSKHGHGAHFHFWQEVNVSKRFPDYGGNGESDGRKLSAVQMN